jgi:hypothetical protein
MRTTAFMRGLLPTAKMFEQYEIIKGKLSGGAFATRILNPSSAASYGQEKQKLRRTIRAI